MSYSTDGLRLLVPGIGNGPSIWYYKSDDAHTDVDATDYFSDARNRGMKDNDVVIVVDEDTATTTIHHISAIDSDGNGTIAAATLA